MPIAPFTSPHLVSMLRLSITRAPTPTLTTASRPAVLLQSLFNLSSCSAAFLCHLLELFVSSTSSEQKISFFWTVKTYQHLLIQLITLFSGEKQTHRNFAFLLKLTENFRNRNFNDTFFKSVERFLCWSRSPYATQHVGEVFIFFLPFIYVSSSYTTEFVEILIDAAQPSLRHWDFLVLFSNTTLPLTSCN